MKGANGASGDGGAGGAGAAPPVETRPALPPSAAPPDRARQVELLISNLLRIGVVTSLAVVIAGSVLTFVHHRDYVSSPQELARLTRPGAAFPRTPAEVLDGLRRLQGRAVVVLGLLLLVATPVMRVAVSVLAFVYERDRAFVIITAVVLALLLLSFVLGKVEG